MKQSDSINELATALAKAQGEIKDAPLDSINPHFKNKYASLESMLKTIRPVFAKHGLSIIQMPHTNTEGKHLLTTRLMHSSGQWLESDLQLLLMKQDMQGIGAATTYARRQAVSAVAGISSDEDNDGEPAAVSSKPIPKPIVNHAPKPVKSEVMTEADVLADTVINFGKFQGKTFRQVGPKDLGNFANWLKTEMAKSGGDFKPEQKKFIAAADKYIQSTQGA